MAAAVKGRPAKGYFLKDGTKVPSVTTIISRFKEMGGLMFWAFKQGQEGAATLYEKRDEAGDVGHYVHALIDADLSKVEPPAPPRGMTPALIEQAQQGFTSFIGWMDSSKIIVESLETPMVSEIYGFGGTPDGKGIEPAGLSIVDWKSSGAVYLSEHILQLVAYEILWNENHPDTPVSNGYHLVRFGKMGDQFTHVRIGPTHHMIAVARRQFLRLVEAYQDAKTLDQLKA